jgi:hypothetical protein
MSTKAIGADVDLVNLNGITPVQSKQSGKGFATDGPLRWS